jgi:hypothetical protein
MSEPLFLEELDGVCINFIEGKPETVKDPVTGTEPRPGVKVTQKRK